MVKLITSALSSALLHDKFPLMSTPLPVRQRRGAASSSFFSMPAVYPAGLGHRERGSVQDPETNIQKHPGRWVSQHTSQTGCEYLIFVRGKAVMSLEECIVDKLQNSSHTVLVAVWIFLKRVYCGKSTEQFLFLLIGGDKSGPLYFSCRR